MPPRARPGRCMHYTGLAGPGGVEHKTCAAGVEYRELSEKFADLPCWRATVGLVKCEKRLEPTEAEVKAFDEWSGWRVEKLGEAVVACWLDADQKSRREGVIDCPACRGANTLRYSIAANDHMHGACATDGCLRWMQ